MNEETITEEIVEYVKNISKPVRNKPDGNFSGAKFDNKRLLLDWFLLGRANISKAESVEELIKILKDKYKELEPNFSLPMSMIFAMNDFNPYKYVLYYCARERHEYNYKTPIVNFPGPSELADYNALSHSIGVYDILKNSDYQMKTKEEEQ